jgi:protein dithiol:quinone oxidoreductase
MRRADRLLGGAVLLGVAAVAIALFTQHVLGMLPCAWCVLQRLIFLAVAAAALAGLLWRTPNGTRAAAVLALLLSLCGIAAALWHYFVARSATSCDLSLAERIIAALGLDESLPSVFMPMASCADATVRLLGVPYPLWSLAVFVVLGAGALQLLRRAS